MAQLSDRLNRLAPSATLAMSQKSSEMKAQGIDVINMSVGEPDFNTPDNIKEAAKKAIDENFSRYSPVPGYPDLRKAIVAKLKKENGLDYTVNKVIVGKIKHFISFSEENHPLFRDLMQNNNIIYIIRGAKCAPYGLSWS
jgi:hypothetical protein